MIEKVRRKKYSSAYAALVKLVRFNKQGLVPTVIQDAKTKQLLTLCYMNRRALGLSLKEGLVYVFRRSRNRIMLKGQSSGHVQRIRQVFVDCEGNSLLFLVQQRVAACHAGYFTCYFRRVNRIGKLARVGRKVFDPKQVYKQ